MYSLYFKYDDEVLEIPILPEELTFKINGKNETINLITLGEVNILKDPGLTDVNLQIELPNQMLPYANFPDGYLPPKHFLKKFEETILEKKIFRFILTRTEYYKDSFDVNMLMSIEHYEIKEKGGEPGTIYCDLDLKQYKGYGTEIVTIKEVQEIKDKKQAIATTTKERPSKSTPKSYKIQEGDNLWSIAKLQLNDESKYKEIQKLNNIKDPRELQSGQVLKMP